MVDFDTVLVLGPQGSGKSTQGKRLAEKLGFLFWDMGDLLREIMQQGGPLAEKLAAMKSGMLLPDDLIIEIVKNHLAGVPRAQGFVFDGVPRRIGQAEFLIAYLKEQGRKKPVSLFITVPREVSLERLARRAGIEKRADDAPRAIEERLREYGETMRPVLDYLKKETIFFEIDGRPSVEEIEKSIDRALGLAGVPPSQAAAQV